MQRLVFSFVLLLLGLNCWAAKNTAIIKGHQPAYSGVIINVVGYDDFISRKLVVLASDTVDDNGDFNIIMDLNETRYVQLPLGNYMGLMFIEPGQEYEIVLPERKDKTFADVLNPYFQPVDVFLAVKNAKSDEINYLMDQFDVIYNDYVDKNYYTIFKSPIHNDVDTLIENVEKLFDTVPDPYFKEYREYKYAWLRYVSYMRNDWYVIKDYFNDKPLLYQNIAYMDLFNQMFSNYLSFYMNKKEGVRIYSDVALAKSPYLAKQTLANSLVLKKDSIQELVLLKGLFDAFYVKEYPFQSLIIILDSIAETSTIAEHRKIANNIKEHVLLARVGYPPFNFELRDNFGAFHKCSDYLENYVYLNFCSVDSYSCQQDFPLLKTLYDKYKNEFKIISISIDPDFEKAKNYFAQHGYEWTLLSCQPGNKVLDQYKVKAYPSYYLINPDGKLVMSPAVSPGENFEYQFFNYMQDVKRQKAREQNK